ncbi:hypothetical protein [Agromyces bauzanensis]
MQSTSSAAEPRSRAVVEGERPHRFPRAIASTALVTSSAVAGLGLAWLVEPDLNPFGNGEMASLASRVLGPTTTAGVALGLGLAGVLLAVILLVGRRADRAGVVASGAGALAVTLSITLGSFDVIAFAGYLFGAAAVAAGLVTVAVLIVRAPRLGLPLLGGLAALVAASVWVGVTAEGVMEFVVGFAGALAADALKLAVIGVIVTAMLAWAVIAVAAVGRAPGGRRFEAWLVRHRRLLTILAAAGPLPYAIARASWLTPSPLFAPTGEDLAPAMLATGLMLGAGAVAASVLTLGLILPWGMRFPKWMPRIGGRPVPAATAVVPGAVAAAVLCVSASPLLGLEVGDPGDPVSPLLVNLMLPFWLWGPMLALAVWAYAAWRQRRARELA